MNVSRETVVHPDASLRYLRLELDAFRGAHHRHRQYELTWIEKGSGVRSVGDSVMPFSDGDLVLLGPNVPHCWTTRRRAGSSRAVATVIQFDPELIESGTLPELRPLALALAHAGRGLAVTGPTHTAVTLTMASMIGTEGLGRLAGLVTLLGQLLAGSQDLQPVSTQSSPRVPEGHPAGPLRRDLVLDWIQRHQARPISVVSVCRLAHVSPGAFSRWFHRELGRTFTEYVNDVRCSAACDLLLRSDAAVARIASDCGFTTLSNFNLQFRRRYGRTPREFRALPQGHVPASQ